jgi:DNA (cytosine-5)-methyltransferase 1
VLTVGSLFSGVGGLDLGLERVGMKVLWQCEADPYARRVLAKHWPGTPCYHDVRDIHAEDVERPDVLCGGFPCQDISIAGSGAGIEGGRSGLWREFYRLVRDMEPRYAVMENVPALTFRGLGVILGALAEIGRDAEWSVLSACSLGAPHTRERLFIISYPNGLNGEKGLGTDTPKAANEFRHDREGSEAWLHAASRVARSADGVPDRMDRNRCCGNAVVVNLGEFVGKRILEIEAACRQTSQSVVVTEDDGEPE